jgi:RNA polymerase sigma-70 factor (ECF subfamily)
MNDSISLSGKLLMAHIREPQSASETADSKLVALALAGDEAAFENIFNRHKKLVAVIASRYFRRAEQIEEIIQMTFTKAFFELKHFRGGQDFSLPGWLGRITTNACLDALRKQKRRHENSLDDFSERERDHLTATLTSLNSNAEKNLIGRDLAEKLLKNLPAADRALLQMLYADEMSVGEIAQITGWSPSNIKVRAFRARLALRKILRKFL